LSTRWRINVTVQRRSDVRLNTDPFNFVAKRWDRKEPSFLVSGFEAVCRMVDEHAADRRR